jgi:hypothetical protein
VIALIVVAVVVVLLLFYAVSIPHGLVRRRKQADNAWSQIDVQLERRYDLIPVRPHRPWRLLGCRLLQLHAGRLGQRREQHAGHHHGGADHHRGEREAVERVGDRPEGE